MIKAPTKEKYSFWNFYNENKEDLEKTIWSICWANQQRFSPEDMHSEILIRLHKSDFINQYNPDKGAAFHTYIFMKIKSYARHTIEYYERRQKIDCMTEGLKTNLEDMVEDNFKRKYSIDFSIEDEITYKELCDLIKKELPNNKTKIVFELYYIKNFKLTDIATKLECSAAYITQLKSMIQNTILNLELKEVL